MSFREHLKVSSMLLQYTGRNIVMAVCHISEGKDANGLLVSVALGFWLDTYSSFKKIY